MRTRMKTRDFVNLYLVAKKLSEEGKVFNRFDEISSAVSEAIGYQLKRQHLVTLFRNYPDLSVIYQAKQGRPTGAPRLTVAMVQDRVSSLERSVKDIHNRLGTIMKFINKGGDNA